jgi:hypothetical protein
VGHGQSLHGYYYLPDRGAEGGRQTSLCTFSEARFQQELLKLSLFYQRFLHTENGFKKHFAKVIKSYEIHCSDNDFKVLHEKGFKLCKHLKISN